MAEKRKPAHYVDNKKLYEAFVEWIAARAAAEEAGKKEPQPPAYISESVLLIPKGLASKANFAGYSFRDEMIGDAIENIIQYYRNFDPAKSNNPFAYLTQFAYYAFIRRILKERKQSYVKHKLIQNTGLLDSLITQDHDIDSDYQVSMIETLQMNLNPDLEAYYEGKKATKRERVRVDTSTSIETLLEALNASGVDVEELVELEIE